MLIFQHIDVYTPVDKIAAAEEVAPMTQQGLPLAGIRVLELGHIVAGPSGTFILGELGADVIKIEHPQSGDAARNMANRGASFYFVNRNKRSVAVDLKTPEGRQIFQRLLRTADVVLDNYAPGTLERLGVGYEWARSENPGIIYCSVKGFLPGPNESQPFLDELAQMAGGLAYMTGPPGQPLRAGASIVDIGAATYGVVGVLAALYQRQQTGRGQQVRAGLFETTVFWVGQHITGTQLSGRVPEPMSVYSMGRNMGWGVYQLFPTRDGRQLFIAATSNRHWERLCQELGLTDLGNDPNLNTNAKRVAQRPMLADRIAAVTRQMNYDDLVTRLTEAGIPHAPLNTPTDLLDDPHLQAGRRLLPVDVPDHPGLLAPTLPVLVGDTEYTVRRPPPFLGEHTDEVLREAGYAPAELTDLENRGVIRHQGGMLQVGGGNG